MKWAYWISLYIRTHCVARGLRPLTLAAYEAALRQFSEWLRVARADRSPDFVTARDVLEYLQHLREVRGNGDAAANRSDAPHDHRVRQGWRRAHDSAQPSAG
jgi:site-specific recombinase XerD